MKPKATHERPPKYVREGRVLKSLLAEHGMTPSELGDAYAEKHKTKTGYHHVKKWLDGHFFSKTNQARVAELLNVDPDVFLDSPKKPRLVLVPTTSALARFLEGRDDITKDERGLLLHLESKLSGEAPPDFWPSQLLVLRSFSADRDRRRK